MNDLQYPIILDTDIGDDFDDTFALIFMLASLKFDIKAIVVSTNDTTYKALLVAKILDTLGRKDIPIIKTPSTKYSKNYKQSQQKYLKDYNLANYDGKVIDKDPYQEIYNLINQNEKTLFISLGTLKTLATLLDNYQDFKTKVKVVAMAGSINKGYEESNTPCAEYNIYADVVSAKKVFESDLDFTILPLDVCSFLRLQGKEYERLINSTSIYATTIVENYKAWLIDSIFSNVFSFEKGSSILFDLVVPWYLLFKENFKIEEGGLTILDNGIMKKESNHIIKYAIEIENVDEMFSKTVDCLTKKTS